MSIQIIAISMGQYLAEFILDACFQFNYVTETLLDRVTELYLQID